MATLSVRPHGAHAHGVLAHRNGNAEIRAEFHTDGLYGFVQVDTIAFVVRRSHPVCRQVHAAHIGHACSSHVGERFCHRHAGSGRRRNQGNRGAFAHAHDFTFVSIERCACHGTVGDRHLPRANHLVTANHTRHATVTDRNKERLVGDGGVCKHAVSHVLDSCIGRNHRRVQRTLLTLFVTDHAGRLAKEHAQRHVNRSRAEVPVGQGQVLFGDSLAHHGVRAAFTLTDGVEHIELVAGDCNHIAFLGFVTPDFERAHTRFVVGNVAKFKLTTETAIVHQFREGVGKSTCTHVVNEGNRVFFVHRPAAVDDFLAAAFHFGVLTLHRGKVERFITGTVSHRACCTTTETDKHGRTAEHNQVVTRIDVALFDMFMLDVTETTGQHNRLVVTADFLAVLGIDFLFESTEVTEDVWAAVFVVECSATQRTFNHDVEGRRNAGRATEVLFPRLDCTRQFQVRNTKAREAGLRLTALTRGTFVADFATTTGSGTRERRNRRRVVVGLNLHEDIDFFVVEVVLVRTRVSVEAASDSALHHGGVVLVRTKDVGIVELVGVLDHLEQGLVLFDAVDSPFGTEHLVAAVFRVGLSEHVEFHVGGVAFELGEVLHQVIDFIGAQSEAHFLVGLHEGVAAFGKHRNHVQRTRFFLAEENFQGGGVGENGLGHAVVNLGGDFLTGASRCSTFKLHVVSDGAFNALDSRKTADVSDIGRLGAPRADGTRTRAHHKEFAFKSLGFAGRTVVQHLLQSFGFCIG